MRSPGPVPSARRAAAKARGAGVERGVIGHDIGPQHQGPGCSRATGPCGSSQWLCFIGRIPPRRWEWSAVAARGAARSVLRGGFQGVGLGWGLGAQGEVGMAHDIRDPRGLRRRRGAFRLHAVPQAGRDADRHRLCSGCLAGGKGGGRTRQGEQVGRRKAGRRNVGLPCSDSAT